MNSQKINQWTLQAIIQLFSLGSLHIPCRIMSTPPRYEEDMKWVMVGLTIVRNKMWHYLCLNCEECCFFLPRKKCQYVVRCTNTFWFITLISPLLNLQILHPWGPLCEKTNLERLENFMFIYFHKRHRGRKLILSGMEIKLYIGYHFSTALKLGIILSADTEKEWKEFVRSKCL